MPFEFIDRLVMVMSVAERCCGVCWFTAVSRRLKAQIEAPLVDLPRWYHVEPSRYGVRNGTRDGS